MARCSRGVSALSICSIAVVIGWAGSAAADYHPIQPSMEDKAIVITGHDLTIEQVIDVARHGAKIRYSPEAIQHAADGRGLRQEAGAEGMPVYGLNRGGGALREVVTHDDDKRRIDEMKHGAREGVLPEIDEEELVRVFLVIRANSVPYEEATPEFMQALVDLINARVTPVMYSRGTLGEGDLFLTSNFLATLAGGGDAYYKGERMKASDALAKAGLKPYAGEPGGGTSNAYADALAVLLVDEGRYALEWADLIHTLDKLGMNSSLTPLAGIVQAKRPFKWVAWDAARLLDMLRGSYLFEDDPKRILQDPESMRASYIRQGSAWQAWAALRDNVLVQINSGEQNPAFIVGASPQDSWELATPQFMKYYVKGGPLSHGQHGYVLSNANWDPYPMANEIEAFTNALANMDAAVAERIERFTDRGPTAFFTGIKIADVLSEDQIRKSPSMLEPYFAFMDVWQEIQSLSHSLTPEGNAADIGVADIEAQTRLKGQHGRQAVDLTLELLGYDLLISTYWMDVRLAETPGRKFGQAPTAVWTAFRKAVPWQLDPDQRPDLPFSVQAYRFLKTTPAASFYPGGPKMPDTESERLPEPAKGGK